jgi:hypothetical protein
VPWFQRVAVDGAFKTPTLRNVELTGPYMHNGSMASLEQVVEFYARAGNFAAANARDLDPDINGIPSLTEQDKADLVAFLKSLTDPRVRFERAPFDHPQLFVKDGMVGNHERIQADREQNGIPSLLVKPATGAGGGVALPAFDQSLQASITVARMEEGPGGARVGFVCDKRPRANVTVEFRLSRPGVATLSASSVTFTPATWRVGQELLLTPVSPAPLPGTTVTLITSRAKSTDPGFGGLPVSDLILDFSPDIAMNAAGVGRNAETLAPGGASSSSAQP